MPQYPQKETNVPGKFKEGEAIVPKIVSLVKLSLGKSQNDQNLMIEPVRQLSLQTQKVSIPLFE